MYKNHNFNKECNAKKNECYVAINEKVYKGYHELNLDDRTAHLYFDDKHIASKKMWRAGMFGFEQAVEVDGEEVHCVLDGDQFDIAIHGRYIKNLQTYVPVKMVHGLLYYTIFTGIILMTLFVVFQDKLERYMGVVMMLIWVVCLEIYNIPMAKYTERSEREQKLYEDTGYEDTNKK